MDAQVSTRSNMSKVLAIGLICIRPSQIWHQIEIDVPRTRPGVPLWACEVTQRVSRGQVIYSFRLVLMLLSVTVSGEDLIRLGDSSSCFRLRAGYQRFGNAFLRGISECIRRYVRRILIAGSSLRFIDSRLRSRVVRHDATARQHPSSYRSRLILVSIEVVGWHSGQLHLGSAWNPSPGSTNGGACEADRL